MLPEQPSLGKFPPVARLFVALFTTLMLGVCLWSVWIYAVEKGVISSDQELPAYLSQEKREQLEAAQAEGKTVIAIEDFDGESHLRHNLGLAHVHINGQTLLFFALGAIFLFTSVKKKTKKIVLWLFGSMIVVHTVGLSGQGFYTIFDDLLALSGVVLLLLIAYMCFHIYVDLGREKA